MRPESDIPSSPSGAASGAGSVEPADQAARDELARVRAIAAPLCAANGVELVEVAWSNDRGGRILRVIIDRPLDERQETPPLIAAQLAQPAETVSLEDCVRVSRDLSTALDVEEIIAQSYNLEVSSPGLDRPLRTERDFRRQRGRLAKVKLAEPAPDGQRVLRGTILEADSDGLQMEVDGNLHRVPFDNITEARLVFELGAQPKKGGRPRKSRKR
jgi:ribosome maturation factor RimP